MPSDEAHEQLQRIEFLMRVLVELQLAPILEQELSDSRTTKLYELTGDVSAKELAKKLKCSMTTVSDTWKRWERLGLLVKEGNRYRKVIP